jgi:prophage regulatory protein
MPLTKEQRERRRLLRKQARERALTTAAASGQRRILRIAEVEAMTGKARTQIYDDIEEGKFPQPVPLGERAKGWVSDEIAGWVAARITERNKQKEVESA